MNPLQEVLDAEKEAARIISEAEKEAARIRDTAKEEQNRIREEKESEKSESIRTQLVTEKEKAQARFREQMDETDKMVDQLVDITASHKPAAVEKVVSGFNDLFAS